MEEKKRSWGGAEMLLKKLGIPFVAVLAALLIGAGVIKFIGVDPLLAYKSLFMGSLSNKNAIAETLVKTTPLVFTALSYAFAARCGLVNLGAEGQLYIGAIFSTFVAINLTGFPMAIHLPLAIIAGFIGGGLWGLLAGWLKVRFGAAEVITTIMLNYIATHFLSFLVTGPMIEPPGSFPQTPQAQLTAILPKIIPGTRLHAGFLVALLAIVFYYYFLWKTTTGYETRVVGLNPTAAEYAGINPTKNALLAMFIAGGFAGLAGTCEILGIQLRMFQNFSPGYGFDGIAVALLGGGGPIGILIAGILFGILRSGANMMQMLARVPIAIIYIIQAFVIIFVISSGFFEKKYNQRKLEKIARQGGTKDGISNSDR